MSLRVMASGKNLTDEGGGRLRAVSFVVERALPGYSGGSLPGRSTKEKQRRGGGREGQQERMKTPSRLYTEQSGKVSSKIGVARKSETRKRRTGKRRTRWKCSGLRMRSWRRFGGEEGEKEVPGSGRHAKST